LRGLLDQDDHARVVAADDQVRLDLSNARVDVLDIERAARTGFENIPQAELAQLCDRFAGDVLDGVEIDSNAEFVGWLAAQRNRYRTFHVDMLRALVARVASEHTFRRLETWLQIAPFDIRAHEIMLEALAKAGRLHDAEDHLATAIRSFEA